ncbi:MAG: hypothetical protein HY913_24240 [Desulfomonile tiedjei]|nr:hypothetical protein [Desulfomonile tiedjei]
MKREEWESICSKCGKCCYEKVDLGAGVVRYTDEPCQHLDVETNLCKVYHNRHEAEPDCISLTEHLVRSLDWLPEDCAYVAHIRHIDTLAEVRVAADNRKRTRNSKRRR